MSLTIAAKLTFLPHDICHPDTLLLALWRPLPSCFLGESSASAQMFLKAVPLVLPLIYDLQLSFSAETAASGHSAAFGLLRRRPCLFREGSFESQPFLCLPTRWSRSQTRISNSSHGSRQGGVQFLRDWHDSSVSPPVNLSLIASQHCSECCLSSCVPALP